MNSRIKGIRYYLPKNQLDNDELSEIYVDWSPEKIFNKTGIRIRPISAENENASDLAEKAAQQLFAETELEPNDVDMIILATQSADYILPCTACLLQERLGISKDTGAFDFNLGCSGYVYGLSIAKGLIAANIAKNILFITADTITKYIHPLDRSLRTLIGDGASATWIGACETEKIEDFVLGSDGSGAQRLIIPAGASRMPKNQVTCIEHEDSKKCIRSSENLYMDGPAIFSFSIEEVPQMVEKLLHKCGKTKDDIDLFVFHQANKFILDFLREQLGIEEEKFYINLKNTGNLSSSSIPIALSMAEDEKKLKYGDIVLLAGFGVGLSWGATIIHY